MRHFLLIGFVAAICTVIGVATWRLSIDALALIIGVGLGFALMTPAVGVLWWAARNNAKALQEQAKPVAPAAPPVIVIQPGSQPAFSHGSAPHQAQHPALMPPPGYPVGLSATAPAARNWDMRFYGDELEQESHETMPEQSQRFR